MKKNEGSRIVEILEKKGFEVVTRPMSSPNPTSIFIWALLQQRSNQTYLGCFRWVAKMGWRMELVFPPIHSDEEFELALNRLVGTHKALEMTKESWDKLRAKRSTRNRLEYLGALAAFYHGDFWPSPE